MGGVSGACEDWLGLPGDAEEIGAVALDFLLTSELSREDAHQQLMEIYRPDYAIELALTGGGEIRWFRSRFVEVTDPFEQPVVVVAPTNMDGVPLVDTGRRVLVYWHTGRSGYAFPTHIVRIGKRDLESGESQAVAWLRPAQGVFRYQRRDFVRVRPLETMHVAVSRQIEIEDPSAIEGLEGVIEDISCGGARIRFDEFTEDDVDSMEAGAGVVVSMVGPPEERSQLLVGEIVRRVRESKPRRALWVGLKWSDASPEKRRILSAYILLCEREQLRIRRQAVETKGAHARG